MIAKTKFFYKVVIKMKTKNALLIDIGGTKTEIEYDNKITKYENKNYDSFENFLEDFLSENSISPNILGIAAAGPVNDGICKLTNLSWMIDIKKIRNTYFPEISLDNTFLLNDLEAAAWYPKNLEDKNIKGNYAVISVGTGLGVAFACYNKKRNEYFIIPTEAGHTIRNIGNGETWEDVLSGQGLLNYYNDFCLSENKKYLTNTKELYQLASKNDFDSLKAVNIFFQNLALFAQNLALITNPQQGIYLTGGIVSNFYKFITLSDFERTFKNNQKMESFLKNIPVYFIEGSAPLKSLQTFIDYTYI
jgi:glucokinase